MDFASAGRRQRGVTLIESLLAVLLLSIGALALMRVQPELRQHAEFCELTRITALIAPTPPAPARTAARLRRLSPATAELLNALSDDLGSGEISEAPRRLARHVETAEGTNKRRSS